MKDPAAPETGEKLWEFGRIMGGHNDERAGGAVELPKSPRRVIL